jgi:tripartite-type tricarboxylate transporter receptor subunit TctC
VDSGRVRALAVSGPSHVDAFPAVPPVAEAGVRGYEAMQWYGMAAPAGTPAPIIARLHVEAAKALQSDEMKEKLALDGAQPVGSTPAEFAALIRRELDKWSRVVRAAGIELQ